MFMEINRVRKIKTGFFIMNGFDSVRMRPEELFRVDAAAVQQWVE